MAGKEHVRCPCGLPAGFWTSERDAGWVTCPWAKIDGGPSRGHNVSQNTGRQQVVDPLAQVTALFCFQPSEHNQAPPTYASMVET
jgi:hypothetical protein